MKCLYCYKSNKEFNIKQCYNCKGNYWENVFNPSEKEKLKTVKLKNREVKLK